MYRISRALAVFVGIMCLVACGSSQTAARPTSVPPVMTAPEIVANPSGHFPDALYRPDPIRVKVGQTITWTNKDPDLHDVTAEKGGFASGPLAYRGIFRWAARHPGKYAYSCTLHPEMHGMITVHA